MIADVFLKEAEEWVGTPRMDGQSKKQIGCDCVGLLIGIAKEIGYLPVGYKEPNYYQTARGDSMVNILSKHLRLTNKNSSLITPGDIVVLEYRQQLTHVGIIGLNNTFIHSHRRLGVVKTELSSFRKKIKQVFELWANSSPLQ